MTIPGRGDLMPRHRRRHPVRVLAGVVVLAVLAGAAYLGYRHFDGSSSGPARSATLPFCKQATVAGPPRPSRVHLTVLNGTLTSGLAAQVAHDLRQRGFHVSNVGNTEKLETGVATVRYGPGELLPAQTVAEQISDAKIVKGTAAGVQLAIGPHYTALASKSAVKAARARFVASYLATASTPSATPSPTPSPTCRQAA